MEVVVQPSFYRDVRGVNHSDLLFVLQQKIEQIEEATDTAHITGTKLLRGYRVYYRILVKTDRHRQSFEETRFGLSASSREKRFIRNFLSIALIFNQVLTRQDPKLFFEHLTEYDPPTPRLLSGLRRASRLSLLIF